MSDVRRGDGSHHRPHAPSMAGAFLEIDLDSERGQLDREKPWTGGHNAKTLVKYDGLRIVLVALEANARIEDHRTDGRISIQALSGHLRVRASGRTFDLRAGSLLALDHDVPHEVEAIADSAFLLTIAWPGQHAEAAGPA